MKYFAYGSNMSTVRLTDRVPSAKRIGVAKLPGYTLAWHKISKDKSGKCDIVKAPPEEFVYGVLYAIDPNEKGRLDAAEGCGYGITSVTVIEEPSHSVHTAFTYCATKVDSTLRPYTWYKQHVLFGAEQHGLPPQYIRLIESAESVDDPDSARDNMERRVYAHLPRQKR